MATTQQQNALLRQGSKGNDVSAVQQALKNYGFYGGVVDGLFGPKTAQAVKDFQNMTGIKVDAIVGPQTQGKIQEWAQNPTAGMMNDPRVQQLAEQDPIVARALQQAQQGGNQGALLAGAYETGKKGYYFGPDTWISEENLKPFLDVAKKELDPNFNEALNYYKSDFLAGLEKEKADYESSLKDAQDKIYTERNNLYDSLANSGTWLGSEAGKQREMFTDQGNRMLEGLNRDTTYKLSDMARNYERQLGTNDVNDFNFRISRPGSVNSIGKYQAGSGTKSAYNPMGGQQGALRQKYASQVEQYGKQKAGTEFGYPVK